MDKIAIGPGYKKGVVDLDASPEENVKALAKAKGVPVDGITACILDRPRHAKLIEAVRKAGAAIRLIGDGDIAGVIHTTNPTETGIDIYFGIGGAPEGVLAAAALRCIGGQMQTRLHATNDQHRERVRAVGIDDIDRKYTMEELASGDVLFAATGVTSGSMLAGVKVGGVNEIETETVIMRAKTRTVRWIRTEHRERAKFT
jgi:fructose-1,6-bisphosphatase II / sedoheptulose-1,7-bisphosphatase